MRETLNGTPQSQIRTNLIGIKWRTGSRLERTASATRCYNVDIHIHFLPKITRISRLTPGDDQKAGIPAKTGRFPSLMSSASISITQGCKEACPYVVLEHCLGMHQNRRGSVPTHASLASCRLLWQRICIKVVKVSVILTALCNCTAPTYPNTHYSRSFPPPLCQHALNCLKRNYYNLTKQRRTVNSR